MAFDVNSATVDDWVEYIQTLHFRDIELTLERVRSVYQTLYPRGVGYKVITVAGTNGKGSTAEIAASILREAGYSVGKFSSPHLVDFAERFNINGRDVSSAPLLKSLKKIEQARGQTPITFFEYGALLAIDLFMQADVDVAVMEVGLGGRLDAINILDPDVALITSISIDHTSWLGDTLDKIAFEKVGIARANTPCVVGIVSPPTSIIEHCTSIGADLMCLGEHFSFQAPLPLSQGAPVREKNARRWSWQSGDFKLTELPLPFQQADVQLSNAACAIMAMHQLNDALPVSATAIKRGLTQATLLARCQIVARTPTVILDVAHNESSIRRLADFTLNQDCAGKVIAIVGMLRDKDIAQSLQHMLGVVDSWNFVGITGERGASAEYVQGQLAESRSAAEINRDTCYECVEAAYDEVVPTLKSDDLLLVFGSFYIAGDILRHIRTLGYSG